MSCGGSWEVTDLITREMIEVSIGSRAVIFGKILRNLLGERNVTHLDFCGYLWVFLRGKKSEIRCLVSLSLSRIIWATHGKFRGGNGKEGDCIVVFTLLLTIYYIPLGSLLKI